MSDIHILGDWGVSACRLFLMQGDRVCDTVRGPGIKFTDAPERAFADMVSMWGLDGATETLLCGTVGANIGWRDAGYVGAPAEVADLARAATRIEGTRVVILPGVRTASNHFGSEDVMRSEDIQALGACHLSGRGSALLCLPGSHTKWVEVEDERIANFTTGFVGELFEVLSAHSTLGGTGDAPARGSEFAEGVGLGADHPALLSGLFDVRARAAQNREGGDASRERLSGFLVGADCAAMLDTLGRPPDAIVGDGDIAKRYQSALRILGADVAIIDGEAATLSGLRMARDAMSTGTQDTLRN